MFAFLKTQPVEVPTVHRDTEDSTEHDTTAVESTPTRPSNAPEKVFLKTLELRSRNIHSYTVKRRKKAVLRFLRAREEVVSAINKVREDGSSSKRTPRKLSTRSNKKLISDIADGVILCEFVNSLAPGVVSTIKSTTGVRGVKKTTAALENTTAFIDACKRLGVPKEVLFEPNDLIERRNFAKVVFCLQSLLNSVKRRVFENTFIIKGEDAANRPETVSVSDNEEEPMVTPSSSRVQTRRVTRSRSRSVTPVTAADLEDNALASTKTVDHDTAQVQKILFGIEQSRARRKVEFSEKEIQAAEDGMDESELDGLEMLFKESEFSAGESLSQSESELDSATENEEETSPAASRVRYGRRLNRYRTLAAYQTASQPMKPLEDALSSSSQQQGRSSRDFNILAGSALVLLLWVFFWLTNELRDRTLL